MNPDGSNKKQLTKSGNISAIFGWSPDNSKIAVLTSDQESGYMLSVIDPKDGEIKKIKESECITNKYSWISNEEILNIQSACADTTPAKVEKISVAGKSEVLLTFPKDIPEIARTFDLGSSGLAFSDNLEWMAFDKKPCCEGTNFPSEVYSYNLKNKTQKKLTSNGENILEDINQGKIIFTHKGTEVWEINPDGTSLKKLFEDKDLVDYQTPNVNVTLSLRSSQNNSKFLYNKFVGWDEYYLRDQLTGKKKMVVKQEFNDSPYDVYLSPDSSFMVYTQRFGHDETKDPVVCWTKFLESEKVIQTTDEKCFYPRISN